YMRPIATRALLPSALVRRRLGKAAPNLAIPRRPPVGCTGPRRAAPAGRKGAGRRPASGYPRIAPGKAFCMILLAIVRRRETCHHPPLGSGGSGGLFEFPSEGFGVSGAFSAGREGTMCALPSLVL